MGFAREAGFVQLVPGLGLAQVLPSRCLLVEETLVCSGTRRGGKKGGLALFLNKQICKFNFNIEGYYPGILSWDIILGCENHFPQLGVHSMNALR